MSDAHLIKLLNKVLDERGLVKEHTAQLNTKIDRIDELLNFMLRQVNDLSAKKDIEISTLAIKTTQPKKKAGGKKTVNIMAYFKAKCTESLDFSYNIIPKAEVDQLLADHKDDLAKKKKNAPATIASLIYKELICNNDSYKNKLYSLKNDEEDSALAEEKEIGEEDAVDTVLQEPVEQAESVDPVEPVDPVDPVEPADHVEPVEPEPKPVKAKKTTKKKVERKDNLVEHDEVEVEQHDIEPLPDTAIVVPKKTTKKTTKTTKKTTKSKPVEPEPEVVPEEESKEEPEAAPEPEVVPEEPEPPKKKMVKRLVTKKVSKKKSV